MRNIEKYPHNANTVTVYLPNHVIKELDRVCEMTGLSRGKVLTEMGTKCLPKAKLTKQEIYALSFD